MKRGAAAGPTRRKGDLTKSEAKRDMISKQKNACHATHTLYIQRERERERERKKERERERKRERESERA
jgi:hypothetical protein